VAIWDAHNIDTGYLNHLSSLRADGIIGDHTTKL
jgi:hypothetical protein